LGYSRLLIIDGLDSACNAMLAAMLLFGMRLNHRRTVSRDYPYGLGKSLFAVILLVGLLLAIVGSMILAMSVKTFATAPGFEPTGLGLATAMISIGSNAALVRFLREVGDKHGNAEMRKMARLQWMNVLSSTVVVNSLLISALLGWAVVERLGAIVISLIVIWLSIRILEVSLDGIMDRSSGEATVARISRWVGSLDRVERIEWVRTRHIGSGLSVDLRVGIGGEYTMREADQVADEIRERLGREIKGVSHVTVDCCPA